MSTKKWIVTYTKHVRQKRKVYKDGVLEISSGKVMLYDDSKALIDRRFLKKDEIIESGGTLSFETHLVDIGDPDGNNKPSAESIVMSGNRFESQKVKCSEYSQRRILGGHSVGFVKREGSSRSHLSPKDEGVIEKCVKLVASTKGVENEVSGCGASNAITYAADLQEHSEKVKNYSSSKVATVFNSSAAIKRDACQILSILKKPRFEGNLVIEDSSAEQTLASQSSDRCETDSPASLKASKSAATIVIDADFEGSSTTNYFSSVLLSGAAAPNTSPTKSSIKSIGSGQPSLTSIILEVLGDSMLPESVQTDKSDEPISDIGFSKEVIHDMNNIVPLEKPLETVKEIQHFDASTYCLLKSSMHAEERSTLSGMDTPGLSSDSTTGQLCAMMSQAGEKNDTIPRTSTLTGHATSDTIKAPEMPSSMVFTNATDVPSFDLGF